MFYGIEKAYADAMIRALQNARRTLNDTLVEDAVNSSHVVHKGDTLGLDQRPENAITSALERFDPHCIIITEERGAVNPFAIEGQGVMQGPRTFFGCDPFDRSNQGRDFLKEHGKPGERIIDVIRRPKSCSLWEKQYGSPISITSSTSAIACVRRGLPIASVILNHFAESMTLACAAGIYHTKLPRDLSTAVDLDYIQEMKCTPFSRHAMRRIKSGFFQKRNATKSSQNRPFVLLYANETACEWTVSFAHLD